MGQLTLRDEGEYYNKSIKNLLSKLSIEKTNHTDIYVDVRIPNPTPADHGGVVVTQSKDMGKSAAARRSAGGRTCHRNSGLGRRRARPTGVIAMAGKLLELFRKASRKYARSCSSMFGAPSICRRCINTFLKPDRRILLRFSSTGQFLHFSYSLNNHSNLSQQAMAPFRQHCSRERAIWPRSTID